MIKEILENLLIEFDEMGYEPTTLCDNEREVESFRNRLKQVLDYLKSIDNANPSEALEFIKILLDVSGSEKHFINLAYSDTRLNLIKTKQALLKSQEQEKVLEILKSKKYIPLEQINPKFWNNEEDYDETVDYEFYLWLCEEECEYVVKEEQKLTQEEFDLLKRYFGNEHTSSK